MVRKDDLHPPLVSVVIPTYNRASVLPRAIESALNQTYDNIEVLVVDDGSTDDTSRVVSDYLGGSVEYIRLEENQGANAARNTGLKAASGKYIAFLDSDDEWKTSKIEKQVDEFEAAPEEVGVVYTGIESVNKNNDVIGVNAPNFQGKVTTRMLCDDLPGLLSSAMIKQETWKECGLLDENLGSGQDWAYFTRCSLYWEFRAVPEPLVRCHYEQSNRISRNHIPEEKYKDYLDRFGDLIQDLDFLERKRVISAHMFKIGRSNLNSGEYEKARKYLLKAILQNPVKLKYYLFFLVSIGGKRTYIAIRDLKRQYVNLLNR